MTSDTRPKKPEPPLLSESNAAAAEQEEKLKAVRVTTGRYKLIEAVRAIAAATGEALGESRERSLLEQLKQDAWNGLLPMYEPAHEQRYRYGTGAGGASRVRDFFEEAYWCDLNQWLKSREPRLALKFQFPEPDRKRSGMPQPKKQSAHQEDEILRVITELGYQPKALPKPTGKSGIKAQVRAKLPFSVKVFDSAWYRLRAQRSIVDAEG